MLADGKSILQRICTCLAYSLLFHCITQRLKPEAGHNKRGHVVFAAVWAWGPCLPYLDQAVIAAVSNIEVLGEQVSPGPTLPAYWLPQSWSQFLAIAAPAETMVMASTGGAASCVHHHNMRQ